VGVVPSFCCLLCLLRLARPAEHVMRALQQLGFDEWAAEVKASHEEFKEEAKSEFLGGFGRGIWYH
jgi:hypothetical protein